MAMLNDPAIAMWFRNGCMLLAALGGARIAWLGLRRYKTDTTWQLVAVGGMVFGLAYFAVLATSNFGDSFFALTHRGPAAVADYVYFLKAGLLLALVGAFSVSKTLRS